MNNKGLAAVCLLVVAGILAAALWPFSPHPRNEVTWAPDGRGLRFGDYGSVFSSSDAVRPPSPDGNCSLEIWLTPGLTDDFNVILAYARPDNPRQFMVGQNGDSFYAVRIRDGSSKGPYIEVKRVFHQGTPVLLTLTAGKQGTKVYLNGKLAKTRLDFGLTADALAGRMVVANSPVGNNSWSGLLQGIAVYGVELSEEDVARHYDAWPAGDRSNLVAQGSDVLYLFREGSGTTVHNLGASKQPDLYIPAHYLILNPGFLRPFWKDYYGDAVAIKDVVNNIVAFIPLGFLLAAWLSRFQSVGRSFWFALFIGSLLSLTIEVLQYFIPMRISDTMDWLLNTGGTMIGAWLYVLEARYHWLGRLPLAGRIWKVLYPANSPATSSVESKLTA
jgi:VanZ like family/Concanavalin A-like lectin/glucanases superfamily